MSQVHPRARTTPRTRAEIIHAWIPRQSWPCATTSRWPPCGVEVPRRLVRSPALPHTLNTSLSSAQELLAVELRRMLRFPLEDLLVLTREFVNLDVSSSGLNRCLVRHSVTTLASLDPPADDADLAIQDVQGPRARLPPHRHQLLATDGPRNAPPEPVRCYRPG